MGDKPFIKIIVEEDVAPKRRWFVLVPVLLVALLGCITLGKLWLCSAPPKRVSQVRSTKKPETVSAPTGTTQPHVEAPRHEPSCNFFNANDNVRDALSMLDIKKVERGRGGRSVAFKITFADGSKGYFKPEQTFSGTHWYSEVAAYHVDRSLCLGRVAPVVGRKFRWSDLSPVFAGDDKIKEVIVGEDGWVRGSLAHWVEAHLVPLDLGVGFERFFRLEGEFVITPFQRASDITLLHAKRRGERISELAEVEGYKHTESLDTVDRARELSDMILFDHLIMNIDRWGGQFTNVRTIEPKGPLMYLDNAAGFIPHAVSSPLMDSRLRGLQRFSRTMVEKIKTLSREDIERRIATESVGPVLTVEQVDDLFKRRDQILAHIEAMRVKFGEAVFTWP